MNTIEKLYKEWMSLQPVDNAIQDKIDRKFMLEFNYNSNHIEGNTLTYGQTELLLIFDKVDSDAKMHDLEEMKAHNVGLKMMLEEAGTADRPLTEYFIRELHRTLLREDYTVTKNLSDGSVISYDVHAGQYKTRPNSVITPSGERFEYASPEETPALMTDLVEWYNQVVTGGKYSALELASLFHYRYIRIHPFEDGNGRIARLLVNFILLRANYPMIIVRSDDKEKYISALNSSDIIVGLTPSDGANAELGQIAPFVDYMRVCLERAISIRISAAKGENIDEEDDWRKEIVIQSKLRKDRPARTIELTTKAVRESFIPAIDSIISNLDICKSICYDINYSVSTGASYQSNWSIPEFHSFAVNNKFQFHTKLNIKIRVAELLPSYNITASVECLFNEFGYKITTTINKETHTTKLYYNTTLSEYQIKKIISFIGNHISHVYRLYCEENDTL